MDEVPIVTSNPVKVPIGASSAAKPKPKGPGTVVNFFLMMPFALVILVITFVFGSQIGDYTTFPFFSWLSLVHVCAVLVLLFLAQVFLRSIVYSTLFASVLVAGIFYGWFGDYFGSVSSHFKDTIEILKSAWASKNLPYNILMSGIIIGVLAVVAVANFFLSLFVKYSFEVVFGREWGDGRTKAFIFMIVLMIACSVGMKFHASSVRGDGIIEWEHRSLYKPLDEFCARIPSGVQIWQDRIYCFDPSGIDVYEQGTGKLIRHKDYPATILTNTWGMVENPVLGNQQALVAYEHELLAEIWRSPYPDKLPGYEPPKNDDGTPGSAPVPLPILYRTDLSRDYILVMYDFGYWSAVSAKDGKMLWIKPIDAQARVNRLFLEEYFRSAWVLIAENLAIFSCTNGRIAAHNVATGDPAWEYQHGENKYAGKGQRGFLTRHGDRLLVTFPSGSVVILDLKKGTRIGEAKNVQWRPLSPAYGEGLEGAFVNGDGNLIRFVLDGGKVLMNHPLYENRPPLHPIPMNIPGNFAAYRSNLYSISSSTSNLEIALTIPQQCFAADPIVDGNYVYAGTQNGWVTCLHTASKSEKWRIKVPGELSEESLFATEQSLYVRTRSGSVFCLLKGDPRQR